MRTQPKSSPTPVAPVPDPHAPAAPFTPTSGAAPLSPDLTIRMGADFDSPLPDDNFPSIHEWNPWNWPRVCSPMNSRAIERADELEDFNEDRNPGHQQYAEAIASVNHA